MSKPRVKRCPECGSLSTIKWGTRKGHTRYYCKNCGSYFTDSRPRIADKNMFVWFELTGRWWYTHKMLHRSTSHIKRAIPNMFNYTRYANVPKS